MRHANHPQFSTTVGSACYLQESMVVAPVLEGRAAQGSFHVVELASDLLLVCRSEAETLRAALLNPKWDSVFTRIRREVAKTVAGRGQLDLDDARALLRIAASTESVGAPEVLVARAFAEGLDAGAGQFFADWFHGADLDLGPNQPFPVAENNVRRWVRKSTGSPGLRTEALDRLPRLRLAPQDLRGLRVTMRWIDAMLSELEHVQRIGLAAVAEPDVFSVFTWDRYTIDSRSLFFNVRPQDPPLLEQAIRDVLTAAEHQVDLLLMPELCLSSELYEALLASGALARIPFVVAGSHHSPAGRGPGQNQASLFVRGKAVATHRKFRPVIFPDRLDDDGGSANVQRHEHLDVEDSRITVLFTGDFSIATLICKDVMDNAVQDMLRELAVQLVLVPAMSPKTEDFADLAQQLGRDPQSFTLVANFGDTVAVVGTPSVDNRVRSYAYAQPGILVFDREGRLLVE